MKELTTEQKAQRYDSNYEVYTELINRLEDVKNAIKKQNYGIAMDILCKPYPQFQVITHSELKESEGSEDERIRKIIKQSLESYFDGKLSIGTNDVDYAACLSWLKKQGKQNNNEDADILYRFSFYSYKDEPNVLYLSGFYVNEEYRNKGIGTKILEVADKVAKSLGCNAIRLKTKKDSDAERLYRTHGYNSLATEDKDEIWLEKQAQKPAEWTEEDEKFVHGLIRGLAAKRDIHGHTTFSSDCIDITETINWLESLKERYAWKPSDEQMEFLWKHAEQNNYDGTILSSLYRDLKKLKG